MAATPLSDMSPDERLALIGTLWDSLDDNDVALTSAQQEELDRRIEALKQGRSGVVSWSELRDELRQRVG